MIQALDWYKGKDVRANQIERGRDAKPVHYLVAAVLEAREQDQSMDYLKGLLDDIDKYVPVRDNTDTNLKNLGF